MKRFFFLKPNRDLPSITAGKIENVRPYRRGRPALSSPPPVVDFTESKPANIRMPDCALPQDYVVEPVWIEEIMQLATKYPKSIRHLSISNRIAFCRAGIMRSSRTSVSAKQKNTSSTAPKAVWLQVSPVHNQVGFPCLACFFYFVNRTKRYPTKNATSVSGRGDEFVKCYARVLAHQACARQILSLHTGQHKVMFDPLFYVIKMLRQLLADQARIAGLDRLQDGSVK